MRAIRRSLPVVLLIALTVAWALRADEGMWPLYDLDKLDWQDLSERGLSLSREDLYNRVDGGLAKAIVQITSGTASFVSPEGLIITNHHIAFSALQKQSTLESHVLRDGFHAATRAEEIPALGYSVHVTLDIEDVTARVQSQVRDAMSDRERYEATEAAIKAIVAETESGRDVKCRVAKMHGGTQFMLYTRFEIKDLRIVHAPPAAIGKFGGDIDNWMWPRHTGDYSFLRAYVGPDGSSAEFAEENRPYRPDTWLKLSAQGIREGDFAMVIGFPGRTSRYASSFSIATLQEQFYPTMINRLTEVLAIYDEASVENPEYALRLAARVSSLNNFLKNSLAMLAGFENSGILAKKREEERRLSRYLREQPSLRQRYGQVLPEMKTLHEEMLQTAERDFAMGGVARVSELFGTAVTLYRWACEREKPDAERERRFQERDAERMVKRLRYMQINLLPDVDRRLFEFGLDLILDLPADQSVAVFDSIFAGRTGVERERFMATWLDGLYGGSQLVDVEARLAMFEMSRAELAALGDPFIDLAVALYPESEARRERDKRFEGAEDRLEPQLIAAYAAWKKGQLYPDANSTKRFNPGTVMGYGVGETLVAQRERGAEEKTPGTCTYLTTLGGLMAKAGDEEPFLVPENLEAAFLVGDSGSYSDPVVADVPVNFVTTNDGTGGNSGSPVLNGKGEIIGLLFDSNYESVAADYLFEPELTRSINVDIRYVLFLVDRVYALEGLLDELTIH